MSGRVARPESSTGVGGQRTTPVEDVARHTVGPPATWLYLWTFDYWAGR
jgi:hypothetical protein